MKPSNIQFLTRPVNPFTIHQRFGEKNACVENATGKVISVSNSVCPAGYRSLYGKGGHNGLDLAAKRWQPVFAAAEGIVIEKETEVDRGLGIGIVTTVPHFCVETGKTEYFKARYWHLAGFDVDLGERVQLGQLVGWADNTGYSSGDHLHFEIKPVRKNAQGEWVNVLDNNTNGAVDPLPYMEPMFALAAADFLRKAREQLAAIADWLSDLIRSGKTTF